VKKISNTKQSNFFPKLTPTHIKQRKPHAGKNLFPRAVYSRTTFNAILSVSTKTILYIKEKINARAGCRFCTGVEALTKQLSAGGS
jgi:hypothetical protein